MTIGIEQIQTLIADAVQIGYMEAVKAYEPSADDLKAKDIHTWCKAVFGSHARVARLIRAGIIKPYRKGDAKNSALYYSKVDIKKALITQRLSQFTADSELQEKGCRV